MTRRAGGQVWDTAPSLPGSDQTSFSLMLWVEMSNNDHRTTVTYVSDPSDWYQNRQLAFSVSAQHLNISAPDTLLHDHDELDMKSVLQYLGQLHDKFSGESPLPSSRRVKKRESDHGLGDSLSSSFSSESSLTSSILFSSFPAPDSRPGPVTNVKTESAVRECRRSYESLLETSTLSYKEREARRQSESFARALQKFSSLSNTNISIKLPTFTPTLTSSSLVAQPDSTSSSSVAQLQSKSSSSNNTETTSSESSSSELKTKSQDVQTTSTQTDSLEEHGLMVMSDKPDHVSRPLHVSSPGHVYHSDVFWGPRDYYATQYSGSYQMYSTLV